MDLSDGGLRGIPPNIKIAFVVLSATYSSSQLTDELGPGDNGWTRGDRPSAKYSGWEIAETASSNQELGPALTRLLARIEALGDRLDRLVAAPEAIESVAVWIWANVDEDAFGFSMQPWIASALARLGATLNVSVLPVKKVKVGRPAARS
jgi:hypothetical protein